MSALTIGSLKKAVTTAGTRVQLSSSTILARYIELRALSGNTGNIFVGDSTVASANGHQLDGGEYMRFGDPSGKNSVDEIDLSSIWLDSSSNGDAVTVFWAK